VRTLADAMLCHLIQCPRQAALVIVLGRCLRSGNGALPFRLCTRAINKIGFQQAASCHPPCVRSGSSDEEIRRSWVFRVMHWKSMGGLSAY
jgi:hypothetical protein